MKRSRLFGSLAMVALLCPTICLPAPRGPASRSLPDFDRRPPVPSNTSGLAAHRDAVERLKASVPGAKVETDRIMGTPAFVTAAGGFLTGPGGEGLGVSLRTARAFPTNLPHRVTKGFLAEHAGLFGHGPETLESAEVKRDYVDAHNGLRTTVWQQRLHGISVHGAILKSHVTRRGELVNVSSHCVPDLARAASAGEFKNQAVKDDPPISGRQAVVLAAATLGDSLASDQVVPVEERPAGAEKRQRFIAAPVLKHEAITSLVWLPMSRDTIRLCWQVELISRARNEGYKVLVDAQTGDVLLRQCLTFYLSDASYRVFVRESPTPMLPGHPTPQAAQPPLAARVLVVTNALDTNASPNGWMDDGVNETRGNNVDAYADLQGDDTVGLRPQGNPNRVFDFPFDPAQAPSSYTASSVVQLFYWNNWMHDRLYQLGFTEAAGNFQATNFGRGGLGGDAMIAEAQDSSGTDNAMILPPPNDGSPPRMEMFIMTGPTPYRDSSLDETVVLHEYTHGLSSRLVGAGSGISALQTRSMGEGWSDFYCLALTADPGNDVDATYPQASYFAYLMTYGGVSNTENYYYGGRRYPYTTDMDRNPLTFKDIDPTQADRHPGVPRSPAMDPMDPVEFADEVHFAGEVWCAVLWEVRANLLRKYGPVGNEIALQLVTDGMKLAPVDPNFLQARDAILQADLVNSGYANFDEIWRAFAKRGMGGSASSPDSSTTLGVQESYSLPGLALESARAIDLATGNANGVVDPNECNELAVVLINTGRTNATRILASLTSPTPGIVISQADSPYPDILPASTGTNLLFFRFYTMPNIICGTIIRLSLQVVSDQDVRIIPLELESGQIGQAVRFDNNVALPIPDASAAGVDSPIVVSGFSSALSKVTLSLHIAHTFDYDLAMDLIGPDGTRVALAANPSSGWFGTDFGTACAPDAARTTFDDKGTITIENGSPPFVGTFKPQQPLAKFKGKSGPAVNGVWRLHVADHYRRDTGTLECWSLHLSPTLCSNGGGDCSTDLAVSGSLSPNPPYVGANITYTFIVTNRGPNAGREVLLTDTLPARTTFVSATSDRGQCTAAGAAVNCRLGTLPNGASARVTVEVRPDQTTIGTITNTVTVASAVTDSDLANNAVTLISEVLPPTPVIVAAGATVVAESANPPNGSVDIGETLTLGLSLQNLGSKDAANLVARLLAVGGITPQTASQTYGRMPPGAAPVTRNFTFTASGTNGGSVIVTLELADGANVLPSVVFPFGLSATILLTNQSRISVPDLGAATNLYPSSITVRDMPGLIRKVAVTLLNVQHTSPADLDVLLVGPKGDTVLLLSDAGGGYGLNNVNLTMEDGGAPLPQASQIVTGTYGPTDYPPAEVLPAPAPAGPYGSALGVLNGQCPNGVWSLFVADHSGGDAGRIGGGWALTLLTADPVNTTADLKIVGRGAPDPILIGGTVTYTLLITNLGPDTVHAVTVTNTLPPNTSILGASASAGSCTDVGGQVRCALGTLTNQASATVVIVAQALGSGTLTNIAAIGGKALDPNALNSRAAILTSVTPQADLAVQLAAPATLPINDTLTCTVTVTNRGPDKAMGVWLTNLLPAALTGIGFTASQGSCTLSGNRLVCNLLTVPNAGRATVTIQGRSTTLGNLAWTARLVALTPMDTVQANNDAAAMTMVTDPYVILVPDGVRLITESFVPPSGGLDPGETVKVALSLRNMGVFHTTALVATLRNAGGVTAPSGPQTYGVAPAGGPGVAREFTFTAAGTNGGAVIATLELQDGTNNLGTAVFPFVLCGGAHCASSRPVAIPDNGTATAYPSTLWVSNLAGVVDTVTVTLSNLSHAYPSDVDVLLVSPEGQAALLMSDAGAGNGVTNVRLTFDEAAPCVLPRFERIESGTYRPTDCPPAETFPAPAPPGPYLASLSRFKHSAPNGPWSLFIVDDAFGDLGSLNGGWTLAITTVGFLNYPLRAPRLASPVILADGRVQFTVEGDAGAPCTIEASEDLKTWTTVGTVHLPGCSTPFADTYCDSFNHRFYRVRLSP